MTTAFRAEVARSLRAHRRGLALATAGIVAVDVFAFSALGDALTTQRAEFLGPIAVGLAGGVVALDLFGGDLRSGSHALVLRTPRAHAATVPARLALLFGSMAVALALEAALRAALGAALHPPRDWKWSAKWTDGVLIRTRVPLEPLYRFGLRLWLVNVGLVSSLCTWTALGSAWTRARPPAALLGTAALGAALASILAVTARAEGFFPILPSDAVGIWTVGTVVGISALAWGWGRGRRFVATGGACAARALAVVAVVVLAADAALAAGAARWIDLRPGDDDLRIGTTMLGSSRRHLVLEASRGLAHGEPDFPYAEPRRWSKPHAWVVDLGTAAVKDLGIARRVMPPLDTAGQRRTVDPQPWVVVRDDYGVWNDTFEWWVEGSSGKVLLTRELREDPPPPVVPVAWRREVRRANTPVRDAAGRRAWLENLRVARERETPSGDLGPGIDVGNVHLRPAPGGWFGPLNGEGDPGSYVFIDATSGARRAVRFPAGTAFSPTWLGRDGILFGARDDAAKERRPHWELLPEGAGASHAVGRGLPFLNQPSVVADGEILVTVPRRAEDPDGAQVLVLWRPATEERRNLALAGPSLEGWRWLGRTERRSDGPWLLTLRPPSPSGGRYDSRVAYVLIDPAAPAATALTPWLPGELQVVTLDDDRSLVAVEDHRRVVRYGPEPGVRTVLFPRDR